MEAWLADVLGMVAAVLFLVYLYTRPSQSRGESSSTPPVPDKHVAAVKQAPTANDDARMLASIYDRCQNEKSIDLSALELRLLPPDLALRAAHVTALTFRFTRGMSAPHVLLGLSNLRKLTVVGTAITVEALDVIRALPVACEYVDLRGCQTIAAIPGFCTPQHLWSLSWERRFKSLLLPGGCAYEAGEVVKGFPKVGVVVVALAHPLRLGDVVQFARADSSAGAHEWLSKTTVVTSIRNDGHDQLIEAVPQSEAAFGSIFTQFAIQVEEVGKKGDRVLWLGHQYASA